MPLSAAILAAAGEGGMAVGAAPGAGARGAAAGASGRRGDVGSGRAFLGWRRGARAGAADHDLAEQRAGQHRFALLGDDLRKNARRRAR